MRVLREGQVLAEWDWQALFAAWWSVTHAMQRLRDNPACADAEREAARRFDAPGLQPVLTFDAAEDVAAPYMDVQVPRAQDAQERPPYMDVQVPRAQDAQERPPFVSTGARPKVAILREQGVNSQMETAYAFDRAGFDAFDVHMSDLIAGRFDLKDFHALAACGGFSYGDVLGAGRGWAT